MIEIDPRLALDAAILAAVEKPGRLHSIFLAVAETLPVEKREVRDALQRLRKAGAVRCDLTTGKWCPER